VNSVHIELPIITDISLEHTVATPVCHLILLQWILAVYYCDFLFCNYRNSFMCFILLLQLTVFFHFYVQETRAPHGPGTPLSSPPCTFISSSFALFYCLLFHFFIRFTYFLLSILSPFSTRVVPLRFQAGGCRRRPNLGLVCCVYYGRPV